MRQSEYKRAEPQLCMVYLEHQPDYELPNPNCPRTYHSPEGFKGFRERSLGGDVRLLLLVSVHVVGVHVVGAGDALDLGEDHPASKEQLIFTFKNSEWHDI